MQFVANISAQVDIVKQNFQKTRQQATLNSGNPLTIIQPRRPRHTGIRHQVNNK